MIAEKLKPDERLDAADRRLRKIFGDQQGQYLRKIMDEGLLDPILGKGVGEVIRQIANGKHRVTKETTWSPSRTVRSRYFSKSSWSSLDVPL